MMVTPGTANFERRTANLRQALHGRRINRHVLLLGLEVLPGIGVNHPVVGLVYDAGFGIKPLDICTLWIRQGLDEFAAR